MDGNLPGGYHHLHKQKSIRIDDFAAQLARREISSNGSGFLGTTPNLQKAYKMGVCVECGTPTSGAEICNQCSRGPRQLDRLVHSSGFCPLCSGLVTTGAARLCISCKQYVHKECDRSDPSGLDDFVCASCRRSPLVGDAMLNLNTPASPLGADPGSSQLVASSSSDRASTSLNPFLCSPSVRNSNNIPEFADQIYNLSESSPATTSDSARNSPFYPENSPSDVDEDFIPGSSRGGYRGRGGKKKPGRGQGNNMKTRSGGKPPSGVFSDKLGQSTRGKRGKRGANKVPNGKGPGRGRGRGRGSSSLNSQNNHAALQQILIQQQIQQQIQQHQQQVQVQQRSLVREVDENLQDDVGRYSKSDEAEYVRTVVVYNAEIEEFLPQTSLCLICGGVGKCEEWSMVACSNCAQTYHTYCVGLHDKLNTTVAYRGWRCLDCNVCEGCGKGEDESKLVLCDECDLSFHIYCMSPPLSSIPTGPWRCQWCCHCRRCKVRVPTGTELTRDGLCSTCNSLRKCPKCTKCYNLGDKIIRCSQCIRWFHGTCESLYNDEMLDSASQTKMRCSFCKPSKTNIGYLSGDNNSVIVCDGVAMNRCCEELLNSRFMPHLLRPSAIDALGFHRSDSFDHYGSVDDDYIMNDDIDMIVPSGRGRGMGRGGGPGRRVPKLGVGGFYVKIPRHRAMTMDDEYDEEGNKKLKRPRKPRRSQLEDAYPPQIQEGFFGMVPVEGKTLLDRTIIEPALDGEMASTSQLPSSSNGQELSCEATAQLRNDMEESEFLEGVDFSTLDNFEEGDLFNLLGDDDDDDDFGIADDNLNDVMDLIKSEVNPPTMDTQSSTSNFQQGVSCSGSNASLNSSNAFSSTSVAGLQQQPQPFVVPPGPIQTLSRTTSQIDTASNVEKNTALERCGGWEEDEPLGGNSTKAAVLYANVEHPSLKEQHPDWNDRVKQIQRLWRILVPERRQEFVQRARDNRANRGKIPRVRKVQKAHSSSSVDSPTIQSPLPHGYYRPGLIEDRFKVPNIPPGAMGPGPSHMRPDFYQPIQEPPTPQQVRSFTHLSPLQLSEYDALTTRSDALKKNQELLESELARMRKQKKNIAARKRQQQKTIAATDQDGKLVPGSSVPLDPNDEAELDKLQSDIPARQKELDTCKREVKNNQNDIHDFEVKNDCIRTVTDPNEIIRLQQMRAVGGSSGPMPLVSHVPPGHPGVPHGLPSTAASPGYHPMHPQFQMRVPHQMQYVNMLPGQGMGNQSMPLRPPQNFRAPVLGGIRLDSLQSQFDRDIYELLDELIINIDLNQQRSMFQQREQHIRDGNGMLKRLLEPSGPHNLVASLGPSPGGLIEIDAPKTKRKKTQQKKPGVSTNEHDMMIERVSTQLRLLKQQLPQQALEPGPRNPGAAFTFIGISDLPDRPSTEHASSVLCFNLDKKSMEGCDMGHMTLTFVDDFFQSAERGDIASTSQHYSMMDLALIDQPRPSMSHQLLTKLHAVEIPCDPEVVMDKEDVQLGLFDLMGSLTACTERYAVDKVFRNLCRVPEVPPPLEPHRSVFHKKLDISGDVEISVILSNDGKGEVERALNELQKILGIKDEIDYHMDTPPDSPSVTVDLQIAQIKKEPIEASSSSNINRCRACDIVMQVAKVQSTLSQLGLTPSGDVKDESVVFCSTRCYYQFVAISKVALSPDQLTLAESHVDEETLAKLRQISAESFAKCINQGKSLPSAPSLPCDSILTSPRDTRYVMDEGRRDFVQIMRVSDIGSVDSQVKKEKSAIPREDWKVYNNETLSSFKEIQNVKTQLALSPKLGVPLPPYDLDKRICVLCGGVGDGEVQQCGRLLIVNEQFWCHVNCALWSTEVTELSTGEMLHVDSAVVRAFQSICHLCGRAGASILCHKAECNNQFHLPCARRIGGRFVCDRTFFCPKHLDIVGGVVVHNLQSLRRLFFNKDETKLLSVLFDSPQKYHMKMGSFSFFKIGQLLPEQIKSFHTSNFIFPVGYEVSRWFWSSEDPRTRIIYKCSIQERHQRPLFVIRHGDSTWEGCTATEAWQQIFNGVEMARKKTDSLTFFPRYIQGEMLFGLGESSITKITESLPGIDGLYTYTFRHGGSPLLELPLAENPAGCARAEPRFRTLIKHRQKMPMSSPSRPKTTSGSLGEGRENRARGSKSCSSLAEEMAAAQYKLMMQGAGSDWAALIGGRFEPFANNSQSYSLYQKMRKEWKQTVYLARSKIQGLGLYARRDINMGDMIIEYKGEVIRNEVGEVREKRYDAQNRGVYMFRIDEEWIVDATMCGGPARYINHSCDPNCSTRILNPGTANEDKKIIITANRPVKEGEELTYDYQFELEDDTTKIPCLCGAPNCVKWMN